MSAHQYDPAEVLLIVVAPPFVTGQVDGFAPGTFLQAEHAEPNFKLIPGIAGQVTRVRTRLRHGSLDFTLEAASPFNLRLSALAKLDYSTQSGIVAVAVRDRGSVADFFFAPQAWLERMPAMSKGERSGVVKWRFEAPFVDVFHGGLAQVEVPDGPAPFTGEDFG